MVVSLYSRKELTFSYSQKAVSAITTNSSGPPGRWLRWSRHHTRGRGSPSKLLDKLESRSGHSAEKYVKSATQMNISSCLVCRDITILSIFLFISGHFWCGLTEKNYFCNCTIFLISEHYLSAAAAAARREHARVSLGTFTKKQDRKWPFVFEKRGRLWCSSHTDHGMQFFWANCFSGTLRILFSYCWFCNNEKRF